MTKSTERRPHWTYEVRPARAEEASVLVDFQLRMAAETEDLGLDPATLTGGVAAVFADSTRGRYWVATRSGQIVGGLLVTNEWSDWRNGTVWWIQSVFVEPEWRGRGVYRALYEDLRARVESDSELKGIRLYVDLGNHGAQRAYERLGMSREHYHLYEWLKDG